MDLGINHQRLLTTWSGTRPETMGLLTDRQLLPRKELAGVRGRNLSLSHQGSKFNDIYSKQRE